MEFFYFESLVLSGFLYWSTRGCNLTAHSSIHASFILRRGLTRFQLPKILLRLWPSVLNLELIKCRSPCPTLVLKKLNMLIRIIGGFTGNYIESPFNSRKVTGEGWPDYADDGYAFVILINWSICCIQDNSSYPRIKSL